MGVELRSTWMLLAVALATGCPREVPPLRLEPMKIPPAFVAVTPGQTEQSAQHLTGSTLLLKVRDAVTGLRVPKASVGLIGPTLASGLSGATFDLSVGPLGAATYRVRAAAPGYVTRVLATEIKGRSPRCQDQPISTSCPRTPTSTADIALEPGAVAISGRVLDRDSGRPLAGARIQAADEIAYAGPDGSFRLEGLAPGPHALSIRKTGHAGVQLSGTAGDAGEIRLAATGVTVNLANPATVFGSTLASATISRLRSDLLASGVKAVNEGDPTNADVQIVAAPGEDMLPRAAGLLEWVSAGGKLVVLGEWGGLAGYRPEAATALLHPAGIAIQPDLVRSESNVGKPDWPLAAPASPWPFGEAQVALFEAASLFAVPPAQVVLRAPGGYRVAALAGQDPVLGAIAPYGAGFVAALGDTSAWTDATTTGSGPNLWQRDNRSYVVNLILW